MQYSLRRILLSSFCIVITHSITYAQNVGGIGAMLAIDSADGYMMPYIKSVVPNSPAATTLKENVFILKVNDSSCKNKSILDVVAMIRGEVGTHVKLSVADNKKGKHAMDYDLVRISIQQQVSNTPPDPITPFNDWCDNEVKEIHKQRHAIIKTFNSECGDYFFNFNADTGNYHIAAFILEDKGSGGSGTAFVATARVFDNKNEANATYLIKVPESDRGNFSKDRLEGAISFAHPGVGVVNTQIHPLGDVKKCLAMYLVVYK